METQTIDKAAEEAIRKSEREAVTASVTAETRKATRSSTLSEIQARSKKIVENGEAFIKDHGKRSNGKLGETLRGLVNDFVTRDHGDKPDGQIYSELGTACLTEIAKVPNDPYLLRAKTNEKEQKQYSMMRAIKIVAAQRLGMHDVPGIGKIDVCDSRLPRSGFELEIHQDMVRHHKDNGLDIENMGAGGFFIPNDAPSVARRPELSSPEAYAEWKRSAIGERFVRDLYTGDFGSGGALVPTEFMTPVIEPLRNWTLLDKMGCRFMGGLSSNIVIPRQTAVVQPQAVSEIGALALSQPAFDQISFVPLRVGNQTQYSKQLVFQAAPDIEAIIRDDNFAMIAVQVDEYGINGSGVGNQPMGIMNQPGIFSTTFGATATIALIEAMATNIRAANIKKECRLASTSTTRGRWRSIAAALVNSTTVISGQDNAILVGPDNDQRATGRMFEDTQQIPNNQVIMGAWDEYIWAQWAGIEIVVDIYTKAGTGEILLTFNTYNNFNVRHPQGFTVSTDSGAQ